MADSAEILRQIRILTEELGRVVEDERAAGGAETQARIEELAGECARVRAQHDEEQAARQALEHELEVAQSRIDTLVHKLKDARQAAAEAGEEAQRALRRQLEALQQECDEARAELETERTLRKQLEKRGAADELRAAESAAGGDGREVARLRGELEETFAAVVAERRAREGAEEELAEAHKLIAALEKTLKSRPAAEAPAAELRSLAEQLKAAEERAVLLQREALEQAAARAQAEQRVAELETALKTRPAARPEPAVAPVAAGTAPRPPADKALPHELRPPPRPGAMFRPDWDLAGLPCRSADQVLQAWESVSNVQLSLEGYPSQYCAAFLVVLKQGKVKQLFLLFNLKASKHVLVCVPGKPPTDEASLSKTLGEAMKYLQMSGFELDKIKPADIAHQLGGYFLDT